VSYKNQLTNISLICPVHNGLKYTKECLKSLHSSLDKSIYRTAVNVILVDDGSTDGTSKWVNEQYPQVDVLRGDGNLWWSGAVNKGVKHALEYGAEYVLLINNDNVFGEHFVDSMITYAQENGIQIIGCAIRVLGSNVWWALGGYFDKSSGKMGMYKDISELGSHKRVGRGCYSIDWLNGMGTLIHNSVFKTVGYWDDKNFPQYFGDCDFILRAKRNGIDAYVYVDSVIWNDINSTGISYHEHSLSRLFESLFSKKSFWNIKTTCRFLANHGTVSGFVRGLIYKYGTYVGGYVKHQILRVIH